MLFQVVELVLPMSVSKLRYCSLLNLIKVATNKAFHFKYICGSTLERRYDTRIAPHCQIVSGACVGGLNAHHFAFHFCTWLRN
jgi:uncharacterized protein (DUF1919 family)